jgi:hypothetical protein
MAKPVAEGAAKARAREKATTQRKAARRAA